MKFHCIFIELIKGESGFFLAQKNFFGKKKIRFHIDKFNKNTMKLHVFSPLLISYIYLIFSHRLIQATSLQGTRHYGKP